jgi:hypothetical protein
MFIGIPTLAAVRIGDLEAFQNVLNTYNQRFVADGTHSLILRLRHNVIKTALRMISIAYSRISLKDICLKLHLDSEEDTEYIVAKAIRDGVIDAEVDHAGGFMKSKEAGNIYETDEPQKAFQQRIEFCINLHNESVKVSCFTIQDQMIRIQYSTIFFFFNTGYEVSSQCAERRSASILTASKICSANERLLDPVDTGDSELLRERMLDIESALAEAAEDDDEMDGF